MNFYTDNCYGAGSPTAWLTLAVIVVIGLLPFAAWAGLEWGRMQEQDRIARWVRDHVPTIGEPDENGYVPVTYYGRTYVAESIEEAHWFKTALLNDLPFYGMSSG